MGQAVYPLSGQAHHHAAARPRRHEVDGRGVDCKGGDDPRMLAVRGSPPGPEPGRDSMQAIEASRHRPWLRRALLANWGKLSLGIELAGGKKDLHLVGSRKWFEGRPELAAP